MWPQISVGEKEKERESERERAREMYARCWIVSCGYVATISACFHRERERRGKGRGSSGMDGQEED